MQTLSKISYLELKLYSVLERGEMKKLKNKLMVFSIFVVGSISPLCQLSMPCLELILMRFLHNLSFCRDFNISSSQLL